MLSISRRTLVKVISAVLTIAVIAAAVGCGKGGGRREKAMAVYTRTNLAEMNKTSRGFVTRKVQFDAYFIARTNLYPTFPTPFSRTDYVNFSVWAHGARLWQADEIKRSYPQMYVGRQTGGLIDVKNEEPLRILDNLKKYQPVTLYGTVEQDNSGYAWVVVDHFKLLDGVQYSDALIRRLKLADENYAAKEYPIAARDYIKALDIGVPTEVEAWVHKNLGLCRLMLEEWGEAAKQLQLAANTGAGDDECLIALAEAQCALGKPMLAEKNARAALKKNPRSALARSQLAIALGQQKRFGRALEECAEALKLSAANADVLRARGLVEDLSGKLDRAIASYRAAVLSRPADPRIHRELGQLYVKKGDLENARNEFQNVVDSVGATNKLRYCRGCCLLAGTLEALKQPKEAAKKYIDSEKRDENYIPAFMGLGALYASGGMYDESLAQFRRVAEELDPKGEDGFKAWRSMAAVYHAKAAKDPKCTKLAGDCYAKALKIKPKHYNSLLDLGLARWQQEKPDRKKAVAALAKCIMLKPDEPRPHYLSGAILSELKDYSTAARELETAKRLDDKDPRTLFRLGLAYRNLGNDTGALAELRAAAALEVKDPDLKLNIKNSLAYVLTDLGRADSLAEASKLAKEVVDAKGGVAAYLDTLGWVQAQQGKLKDARTTLESARDKAAEPDPENLYHLGHVYAELRRHKDAISALEKAILRYNQVGGNYPRASRLQGTIKSLLSKVKAERAKIEADMRRRYGAVGASAGQSSSPKEGQAPGKRPKPKKDSK
ncbi:MAG: tetratricopeptide repeat protein [Planctomycetota bacterium]|jgi:tetratricopeptide (TPR) repeat protein